MPIKLAVIVLACVAGCVGEVTSSDGGSAVSISLRDDRSNTALSGANVIFQGPDDSIAATVLTDANGAASAMLPDGGSISLTWRGDGETVVAFVTVAAGEQIELALAPDLRGVGSRPRVRMVR